MCGIAAILSYAKRAPVSDRELAAMSAAMQRRGPDGAGMWISGDRNVGLGHRRLAILDISEAGAQPMASRDQRYRIVFNGEIYNYRSLRAELEARGHAFVSTSDTEVVLAAYIEYADKLVDKLRGMFAFAIWDGPRRGLFLARDHFGIKPLYFHDDGSTFRAASQVKALRAGAGIADEIEPAGHVGFYLWGCVPEPYTLYKNVFALPAGHTLWVDACGPRAPHRYFDLTNELAESQARYDSRSTTELVDLALGDSVRAHLVSDVEVGVFLSSGLDSSLIAALAARVEPLRAITLGFREFEGQRADEVPLAAQTARELDIVHHVERIERSDFEDALDDILASMDQPSVDGVNTYFVARAAARAGLKVALSGVGSDELFGGYPSFDHVPLLHRVGSAFGGRWLGKAFRTISAPVIGRFLPPKLASLFEYGSTYGGAYLLRRGLFMPWELVDFLDPNLVAEGWATLQPLLALDRGLSTIKSSRARVSALELGVYMKNMLLRDADWAGMAHSLEIRTPFVDIDVFRTLASAIVSRSPPTKQDVAALLPEPTGSRLRSRPKTGFSVPIHQWTRGGGRAISGGLRDWALRVQPPVTAGAPPRRRALAFVSDAHGGRGGIAKFNRDLLWALSAAPNLDRVTAVPRRRDEVPNDVPLALDLEEPITDQSRYVRRALELATMGRSCELVVCGHLNLLPVAAIVAAAHRKPLWCVLHGIDAWERPASRLVRLALPRVTRFLAVSEVTQQRFASAANVPIEKIELVRNSYDPAVYFPAKGPPPHDALRDRRILLTCGRLAATERYKGFDEVLDVLPDLARRVPNISYVIVGDGDDRSRLEQKARALDLNGHVHFAGYVSESTKLALYRAADAYVMPSRGEGFGIVFLEALACGLPTIASKLDGGREALLDGQLGRLVDPDNRDELREAILEALTDPASFTASGVVVFSLERFRTRIHELVAQDVSSRSSS